MCVYYDIFDGREKSPFSTVTARSIPAFLKTYEGIKVALIPNKFSATNEKYCSME